MNQKNILIASVALNVMLVILIFVVKNNAAGQAKEFVKQQVEPVRAQVTQAIDIKQNNNLLWTIIDNIWKSPDKSKAFVKKMADSQKLPRCKGKECTGDDARLKTSVSDNAKDRSITVGWSKYSFKVIYDDKNKFVTIDVDDLLDKTVQAAAPDEESEEEEE